MIGFIGLGNMGRPMASNLCRKGNKVLVHDVNSAPVRALEELGASSSSHVAHIASQSDVIFTMLPDSAVVAAVVGELLSHARRDSVIVDMSTIDPRVTDRLATAAADKGIQFRRRTGRAPGEPRRAWRVAVHGRRRR